MVRTGSCLFPAKDVIMQKERRTSSLHVQHYLDSSRNQFELRNEKKEALVATGFHDKSDLRAPMFINKKKTLIRVLRSALARPESRDLKQSPTLWHVPILFIRHIVEMLRLSFTHQKTNRLVICVRRRIQ